MKIRSFVMSLGMLFACFGAISSGVFAQNATPPTDTPHEYSAYEKLILKNVSQFHKDFNNRAWEKNGELVADDLHVSSNGVEVNGRDAFVKRIQRFVGPFPDVKIDDQVIMVDGNRAAIRFVITGTQEKDLQTPEGAIPASGKHIRIDGIEWFTFNKAGKLVDLLTVENLAQMIQQLKAKN